jgi:hypothetical protein
LTGNVTKPGYYNYGTLRSTSGANDGYIREIKLHSQSGGVDMQTISPTLVPSGNLSFKRSFDFSASLSPVFSIPAGVWEMGSLSITSHWVLLSGFSPGTDQLTIQFPPGQVNDTIVRANSATPATYVDELTLGDVTLGLINAAAGGTMTMAIRHTVPSSQAPHYFNIDVPAISLTLTGTGGGSTSSRIILHEPFPFPVSAGDTFVAVTGCNRLPGTCTQKFANIINFRGEPTLPGTDKLIQIGRAPQ